MIFYFHLQLWNRKSRLSTRLQQLLRKLLTLGAKPLLPSCKTYPTTFKRLPVKGSIAKPLSPLQWHRQCLATIFRCCNPSSPRVKQGKSLKNSSTNSTASRSSSVMKYMLATWSTMSSLMSSLVIVANITRRCISPIFKSALVNIVINEWIGSSAYSNFSFVEYPI